MRIHGCIIFVVSLFLTTFSATTGTLKGVVKDKSTDQPIANAIVRLIEKGLTDTTDANGNFLFSSFPVSILPKGLSNSSLMQPHYWPGKGIIFVNKNKGYIWLDIFNPSGRMVAVLNNSVLEQGIWSIPLNNIAKGMYICRIKTLDEMNAFRFMIAETGHQRGMPIKMGDINGSKGMFLSKKEASATTIDTLIARIPGYCSDTLLWNEKTSDSVTLFLISSTNNNSEVHFNYLQLYNNLKAIDNFTYCVTGNSWDLMNNYSFYLDTAIIFIKSLSLS